jgi:FkbM family methyltransferase
MLLSRSWYYLSSVLTMVLGIRNWPMMVAVFLGVPVRKPVVVELRKSGHRFRVRTPMDIWIIKETCLDQDYEKASVALRDGWTIVDIGAGLGDFAIHAAGGRPHANVYAYEPFPESFYLMQQNVELNGLTNIRMFPEAVGSGVSEATLFLDAPEAVQLSTVSNADHARVQKRVEVPSTTLDRILDDHDLHSCDFLKIDCEGAEYEILFSTSDRSLQKIKHVCLEYHDGVTQYSHEDLAAFFHSKNFQVRLQANRVHPHLGLLYAFRA